MTTATRPPLQYLHEALDDLKAKNLYFRLRVLEGEQKPVATFDGRAGKILFYANGMAGK